MKVDIAVMGGPEQIGERAREAERAGYDGLWVGETVHDPFLLAMQAAGATTTAEVGTSIAVAFARSPMTLASTAFDLGRFSEGRFVLGLGSQVKVHIERRFSMPWSHPAPRMRELVLAVRAIWACWQEQVPLRFEGEFYQHTLMTPFFSPEPLAAGMPRVFLAGVGEQMTEVAGEVADGFFCHAFTTERYIREVTVPALHRGAAKAGRSAAVDVSVCVPAFIAVGEDQPAVDAAVAACRKQIAFYASTPGYRSVLDLHGWGDLQPTLNTLSKQGRWDEMADLVDDDVLHAFAVVGRPQDVAQGVLAKYADLADRLTLYSPYEVSPSLLVDVADRLRSNGAQP